MLSSSPGTQVKVKGENQLHQVVITWLQLTLHAQNTHKHTHTNAHTHPFRCHCHQEPRWLGGGVPLIEIPNNALHRVEMSAAAQMC